MRPLSLYIALPLLGTMLFLSADCTTRTVAQPTSRIVTIAQSGPADVVGSDSESLQKAANLLRPGDVLSIGAGTYAMENSLFVPSGVTVRGVPGKTILRKARGVESPLTDDADYGDTFLAVAEPEKFHTGMGVAIVDDTLKTGWDISVTSIASIKPPYVLVNPRLRG